MNAENERKIEKVKASVATMSAEEVMAIYRTVEPAKKDLAERQEYIKAVLATLENRLNDFLLETDQTGTITSHGTVKRVLKEVVYVEDAPAFREWAINTQNDALMTISITSSRFKEYENSQYQSYLKHRAEAESEGKELPPYEPVMPPGLRKKQEYKLSITKK